MRSIFLFFITGFIFGCTNNNKIPENILSSQKMERVLWDMIQADRFSALFLRKDSATKNVNLETLKLYEQVFQIHKVSRDNFVRSYKYYLSRPDLSKVIFDSISVKAERQKVNLYKTDSIK